MTKTYNDIEAVTRLLEEKEKDLELTARIGKELLSHNQKLETTVQELENELKNANEKITQLSYEVGKKTELIQVLTNDVEESGESEAGTPTGLRCINLEVMQRKISGLEDENKQLRNEFTKLVHETDDCEEQEARLLKDVANQLANANMEVDGIALELERQKEENRLQHEQIVNLSAKLSETELRLAQLMAEHDEVGTTLVITRDNQNALADELAKFKEQYAEALNMLAETQDQLKQQRKRSMPVARGGALFPSLVAAPQPDSIAMELECSLYSESSLDSGIIADRIPPYKKAFETVRCASRSSANASTDGHQFPRLGSMTTSTLSSGSLGPRMSTVMQARGKHVNSAYPSLDSTGHSDSESLLTDIEEYPGPQQAGIPGAPGAADLEAALRRLTPAEVMARRACLSTGTGYTYEYDGSGQSPPNYVPFGCRTPDSIMSTGSSGNLSGFSGNSSASWRLPEKLQIVKPIEGSQTLHHWSQLATPSLGGLLEDRPGIRTRGGRGLEELGLLTFSLTDVEEDEEYANPGKLFQDTGSVYTFTNSTVMHPDDHTILTGSAISSRVTSQPNSNLNSGVNTPRTLSRRNSTSTFSTTLGLAKMLNERGIVAVTPSCAATPTAEKNFSPTVTPCNSPDISPSHSRSGSPVPGTSSMRHGGLTSGTELLKRTFGGEAFGQGQIPQSGPLTRRSRRDRLERIQAVDGDPRVMERLGTSMSQLAMPGALYARRESSMAHLTFLKGSISSEKLDSELDSSSGSSSPNDDSRFDASFATGRDERSIDIAEDYVARRAAQRHRRNGPRRPRPDLGQVRPLSGTVPVTTESVPQSALGTISSLLFGRKGGLF
ncbi:trafficking kinesin-binding protein milt isoform X2 [Copidosoma floridanum]|nr:trafficking kinesin-binding protein milt isoform X2 [Copidosoma floridanum]XP_014203503.1 trafficking kinesin-binding protein milt isoform X2 [Copidosoma floridanum]XP_014203504.1 trafficking kinesin-binding protein milt isoform X2 [Copidosoma floridanum]